ncbi:type II toxin-antitoxin system Phd/YefM family antitoxin [Streptomyces sp. AP-93]|uniref:type II toxin-antitoxin system Phd/YefM family antitoxin n=1 Tax=Streptomyces sp. AP-93 TaxID=2929048 RepID=UPI001FAE84EA|nr:type II toxin-antitoxin system Phd/YefM family antitoxin [Streptomyces sp. AP-93]MCJ0875536.1 type II toxin-antitoxin system Phd/YefM family antitoxin [Streptomyces sp. AP-93]
MSEPVIESVEEVSSRLADAMDRAYREGVPTIITRGGEQEAVLIGIEEYRLLRRLADEAEDSRLNELADAAERAGAAGSVTLEEMAAVLRHEEC